MLRSFLQDNKTYRYFSHRSERNENSYTGIVDEDIYKRVVSNKSEGFDFSIVWNTDGVKVFKSF